MEEKVVYNLDLTYDEINLIVSTLKELPYKVSAPMIAKIINQVNVIETERQKVLKEQSKEKSTKKEIVNK